MSRPSLHRLPTRLIHQQLFSNPFSTTTLSSPKNNIQIYASASRDPITNLSLEHHLLTKTPPSSTILLLYVNSPSVIFGRNQNPWLETNLAALLPQNSSIPAKHGDVDDVAKAGIQLVRRRSGGGTVFHDEGNVNFSVICPPEVFDRDRHAEMVVRALARLGRQARVNERHDIVVDRPEGTFKISGSAYKLTRLRSLHHGTCLLRSPNLKLISPLLRSPAEPFLKARGVDSVRSPVANVDVGVEEFKDAVVREFRDMYGQEDVREEVGDEAGGLQEIEKGMGELRTRDWVFGQTPKFVFSTEKSEEDNRERPSLPFETRISFEAKKGIIESFAVNGTPTTSPEVVGKSMHEVKDWTRPLEHAGVERSDSASVGRWMNGILGVDFTKLGV